MSILRTLASKARKSPVTWRYLFNLAPTVSYRQPAFDPEAFRILTELNRDGIAVTSAESLFNGDPAYGRMEETVHSLELEQSRQIEARRRDANSTGSAHKSFLYELLGSRPTLDPHSPFAQFALHDRVLQIANAYFGMYTRLREYNVWHTFVSSAGARQSQLWHRDREDLLILKVFVYLNDVDDGAGPFTYAPGTHEKGSIKRAPEFFVEKGVRRTTDAQMAAVVPANRWKKAVGPRGSIIFADTHGYHKGGLCTERDRIMYHCMFTSPASESKELLDRPTEAPRATDLARAVALSPRSNSRFWLGLPAARY
jgi:hypothetical protein